MHFTVADKERLLVSYTQKWCLPDLLKTTFYSLIQPSYLYRVNLSFNGINDLTSETQKPEIKARLASDVEQEKRGRTMMLIEVHT